jgi:small-conductance mechanosensitive channel
MTGLDPAVQNWLTAGGELLLAVVVALLAHVILFAIADRITMKTASTLDESVAEHSRSSIRVLMPLATLFVIAPLTPLPHDVQTPLHYALGLALVATVAWLLIALTWIADDLFLEHLGGAEKIETVEVRATLTQISILRRVLIAVIFIVALAVMLLTLPGGENVGASVLASVGVAGLVFGLAAGPVLSNLLAGVQIALTQPIRLDDVVVIDGEWGTIEEINTTYVVVKIWDLRRLVIPLSTVIQQPFENWTRKTTNLIGTVTVHADYSVPVDEVRAELHRILESTPLWDRQAWGVQVTAAHERTIEVRALLSAADSGALWDLRCLVREKLIAYLNASYPASLPRLRADTTTVRPDTNPGPRPVRPGSRGTPSPKRSTS